MYNFARVLPTCQTHLSGSVLLISTVCDGTFVSENVTSYMSNFSDFHGMIDHVILILVHVGKTSKTVAHRNS